MIRSDAIRESTGFLDEGRAKCYRVTALAITRIKVCNFFATKFAPSNFAAAPDLACASQAREIESSDSALTLVTDRRSGSFRPQERNQSRNKPFALPLRLQNQLVRHRTSSTAQADSHYSPSGFLRRDSLHPPTRRRHGPPTLGSFAGRIAALFRPPPKPSLTRDVYAFKFPFANLQRPR